MSNNRDRFLSAPHHRSGAAGGMQGVARLIGQTAGVVLMTLLFSISAIGAAPPIGLALGAALILAAGLIGARWIAPRGGAAHAFA